MRSDELRKDPIMLSVLSFTERKNTHKKYINSLSKYTEWTKMTTDDLINEANSEWNLPMSQRKVVRRIKGFIAYLNTLDLAPTTKRLHVNDVICFYTKQYIEIPDDLLSTKAPRPLDENQHIPTLDEMRTFLQSCNPRNRAIVLSQSSSGMGRSEICSLKVRHFTEGCDDATNTCTLRIRRVKTDYDYVTFLNPEACRAIKAYIELRNNPIKHHGKRLENYLAKHRIYSDDDYLFIKDDLPDSVLKPLEMTGRVDEELRRLKPRDLDIMYRAVYKKAGFKKTKQRVDIRSHNVRKFFNHNMLENDADLSFVDFMMGHKVDTTHAAYHSPSIERMKKKYLHFMQYVTITEKIEYKSIETKEFKIITDELKAEKEKTALLQQQIAEMQRINSSQHIEIERLMNSTGQIKSTFDSVMGQLTSAGIIKVEPDLIPVPGKKPRPVGNNMEVVEMMPNPKKHMMIKVED